MDLAFLLLVLATYVVVCLIAWKLLFGLAGRLPRWPGLALRSLAFALVFSPSYLMLPAHGGPLFLPLPAGVGALVKAEEPRHALSLAGAFTLAFLFLGCRQAVKEADA